MTETLEQARARSEASGRTRSTTCFSCEYRTTAGWCRPPAELRHEARPGALVCNTHACTAFKTRDR